MQAQTEDIVTADDMFGDYDYFQAILQQHKVMLNVLRKYQGSRWPWVRWIANDIHTEIIARIALAEKVIGGGENR